MPTRLFCLLICLTLSPTALCSQQRDSTIETATFASAVLDARGLATAMRSIAGRIEVEFGDEPNLTVRAPRATLELCREIAALVNKDERQSRLDLPDGSRIVAVRLANADAAEVLTVLRAAVNPARLAVNTSPPLIMVRDTAEKAERALELLNSLDRHAASEP